mmetsp:Transcript_94937/g.163798  ORF Transcript_94937/g.163798 Transcript_94937/m.163798 type:complete len:229 (+) Transcript_94937:7050-7736(+)
MRVCAGCQTLPDQGTGLSNQAQQRPFHTHRICHLEYMCPAQSKGTSSRPGTHFHTPHHPNPCRMCMCRCPVGRPSRSLCHCRAKQPRQGMLHRYPHGSQMHRCRRHHPSSLSCRYISLSPKLHPCNRRAHCIRWQHHQGTDRRKPDQRTLTCRCRCLCLGLHRHTSLEGHRHRPNCWKQGMDWHNPAQRSLCHRCTAQTRHTAHGHSTKPALLSHRDKQDHNLHGGIQ